MAGGKSGPSGPTGSHDTNRRRPQPQTLDLTATEIPAERAGDPSSQPESGAPAASAGAASDASASADAAKTAAAGSEPTIDPSASADPPPATSDLYGDPAASPAPPLGDPAAPIPADAGVAGAAAPDASGQRDDPPSPGDRETPRPRAAETVASDDAVGGENMRQERGRPSAALPPVVAAAGAQPRRPSSWLAGAAGGAVAACIIAGIAIGGLWNSGIMGSQDERGTPLAIRMNDLERQVKQSQAARPDDRIPALMSRLDAAEKSLADAKALEARLTKAEAAAQAPGGADPAFAARLAAAEAAAKQIAENVAELRARATENAGAAQQARDAAMQSSGAVSAATAGLSGDLQAVTARVAALDASLKALQETVAKAAPLDVDRGARFASAAFALRAAVERGDPYETELAALRPLVADAARLAPLEPFAGAGIPSSAALAQELFGLTAARRPPTPAESDTTGSGVFDRLREGASRLVKIKPADDAARPDPGTPMARVEALAVRGDLAGARAELAKLPAAERGATDAWVQKAEQREAALARAQEFAREALVALAKPSAATGAAR